MRQRDTQGGGQTTLRFPYLHIFGGIEGRRVRQKTRAMLNRSDKETEHGSRSLDSRKRRALSACKSKRRIGLFLFGVETSQERVGEMCPLKIPQDEGKMAAARLLTLTLAR